MYGVADVFGDGGADGFGDADDDCRLRSGASCLRHRLVVAGGRGSGYGF